MKWWHTKVLGHWIMHKQSYYMGDGYYGIGYTCSCGKRWEKVRSF